MWSFLFLLLTIFCGLSWNFSVTGVYIPLPVITVIISAINLKSKIHFYSNVYLYNIYRLSQKDDVKITNSFSE